MNTKQVCKQLNVTPKMLRIYEDAGLVHPKRGENNYRQYSSNDMIDIEAIATLRNIGVSIKDIKKMFERRSAGSEYMETFYIQIKAIENRIEELNSIKKSLNHAINHVLNGRSKADIIEIVKCMPPTEKKEDAYDNIKISWDFDDMAANYVERFLKNDISYREGIAKCREIIKSKAYNKKIIDVGCGTCNLWDGFENFCDLTVIDSSLNMLEIAKNKVSWAQIYLFDITADGDIIDGKFDYVISTFMLHHIAENLQMKVIENMAYLCKEGGEIIIVDKYFKCSDDRDAKEKKLQENKDYASFAVLQAEQPIFVDALEQFIKYRGLSMEIEYLSEETACFKIKKSK